MNILFLTFYGFREYILDCKLQFEKQNHNVYNISYYTELNDNKKTEQNIVEQIIQNTEENNINCIFFFLLPPSINFIEKLKHDIHPDIKTFFYNFDDPKSINVDIVKFSSGIDYFITPSIITANKLKCILDCNNIVQLPLFYEYYKYKSVDITEKLDNIISIVYHNDSENIYDNHKIIDSIKMVCLKFGYDLKLFGDEYLEEYYPDIFESILDDNNSQLLTKSKLIIYMKNFEYCDNKNYDGNISFLLNCLYHKNIVMTYNGKQLHDYFKNDYNIIFFDKNFQQKIIDIIENYDKYKCIEKNSHKTITDKFLIDNWCKNIIETIK
jgi:hypothetical protein